MGVRGLSSFIEKENSQILFGDDPFINSKLIIDGCNLYHLLYFNTGLEQNHGGEYDAFDDLITKFFKALRDCGIEPYVILDGGSDCGDTKRDTLMKRAKEKITDAMAHKGDVLPSLAKLVLKQTLTKLEVPFAQCYGEADSHIASLAREWECPVLSNDSDFYVFDLPGGFLPIKHFEWEAGSQSGIPCKYYHTSHFCDNFKIKLKLLPLMAALAGNDHVNSDIGLTYIWNQNSTERPERVPFDMRVHMIVQKLKDFQNPNYALMAVLGLLSPSTKQEKKRIQDQEALTLGMKEYQIPPTSLSRFFKDGSAPDLEPTAVGIVPDWTRLPLTQGRLTSGILDVLLIRRKRLPCQVDLANLPSANITSRPIREVMYGLLLGSETGTTVEEWDREGTLLSKIMVQPRVSEVARQININLHELHQAGYRSVREQVFLETLGVSLNTLKEVPPNLSLPVAVTCYWLQHSSPRPDEKVIQALLLGMVAGESNRQHDVTGELQMDIPKRDFNAADGQPKQDFNVTHAYNQWQVCLGDSIHLNQLLCFPLQEPQIAWLYKGTLVHYLEQRLRKGEEDPELLLQKETSRKGEEDPELLLQKETSRQLYKALLTAVLQSQDVVSTSPTSRREADGWHLVDHKKERKRK